MNTNRIVVVGSSNTDMTVRSKFLPAPGETIIGSGFRMGQGGKGANQAVAAKKLGGNVDFICKLGEDIFGENALRHYREVGLDTSYMLKSVKPSGVALITVDSKAENSIVVASGANGDMKAEDVESMASVIRGAKILLLQLEIPMDAVVRAAQIAHEAGVMVVLNPAPAAFLPDELLQCISILVPNQNECSYISGMEVTDIESAAKAADLIKGKGVHDVIVTLGAEGSLVSNSSVSRFPAIKVSAVDTTAAGDTFCAGLCVALSEGRSLSDAVRFATAASAISVQRPGAQESVPTREEVDKLLENQ